MSKKTQKKALNNMVEALINGKTEDAQIQFHTYIQKKSRAILEMGNVEMEFEEDGEDGDDEEFEGDDSDDFENDDEFNGDNGEDEDDDEDDDEDEDPVTKTIRMMSASSGDDMSDGGMSESFNQPTEGSMSKKVEKGKASYKEGGKRKTAKKFKNSAPHLDDDSVSKLKFSSGGNKKTAKTLEPIKTPNKFDDGRDFCLGTAYK